MKPTMICPRIQPQFQHFLLAQSSLVMPGHSGSFLPLALTQVRIHLPETIAHPIPIFLAGRHSSYRPPCRCYFLQEVLFDSTRPPPPSLVKVQAVWPMNSGPLCILPSKHLQPHHVDLPDQPRRLGALCEQRSCPSNCRVSRAQCKASHLGSAPCILVT